MFKWLIKLFFHHKKDECPPGDTVMTMDHATRCDYSQDIRRVRNEKDAITDPDIDWIAIRVQNQPKITIREFLPSVPSKILDLSERNRMRREKRAREEAEAKRLAIEYRRQAEAISSQIQSAVDGENLPLAQLLMSRLLSIANSDNSMPIRLMYNKAKLSIGQLESLLYQRKLAEERERRRKAEEEEKRQQEERERQRKEKERREAEERQAREEASMQLLRESRKKEEQERQEKARIEALKYKESKEEILQYLKSNGIRCFYHFTDINNVASIKKYGGLFSWEYCKKNGIEIPYPGGDETSRSLDMRHGLQDYVRLSFCNDHPMTYRLKQNGRQLVLLRIGLKAAVLRNTLFSNMNATDNEHSSGPRMLDLQKVNMDAVKETFVRRDSEYFKPHQAEVLVKTFVPLDLIENIDNPTYM